MKRWDVYQDGKWVDGVQARDHSEAVLEALGKLDLADESGLDVRLAAQRSGKVEPCPSCPRFKRSVLARTAATTMSSTSFRPTVVAASTVVASTGTPRTTPTCTTASMRRSVSGRFAGAVISRWQAGTKTRTTRTTPRIITVDNREKIVAKRLTAAQMEARYEALVEASEHHELDEQTP